MQIFRKQRFRNSSASECIILPYWRNPAGKEPNPTNQLVFICSPQSFAVEILANDLHDVKFDHVKQLIMKAGGANYGTGVHK